jgi:16S rRNA (adenine1518-N6/adenine1519-N6)-dimethyltransferase
MLKLSEVRLILREHNIHPSKRLGQNFLIDQNIKNKIINSIQLSKEDTVLEIGPGLGALTEDLCKNSKKVISIEKDTRLYDFLRACHCESRRSRDEAISNLELLNIDILKYEFKNSPQKLIIVGNLPYSISSPILNHLIDNRTAIDSAYITVQKEFGERVVAGPGTKDYASLSCYIQFYAEPKILFNIPRAAFFPAPEVDSCFLRLSMRKKKPFDVNEDLFFKIVRSAFGKRRKTITSSLYSAGIFPSKEALLAALKKAGISASARPETLSLEQFSSLTNCV